MLLEEPHVTSSVPYGMSMLQGVALVSGCLGVLLGLDLSSAGRGETWVGHGAGVATTTPTTILHLMRITQNIQLRALGRGLKTSC